MQVRWQTYSSWGGLLDSAFGSVGGRNLAIPGRGYGQISVLPDRKRRWILGEMDQNRNRPISKK